MSFARLMRSVRGIHHIFCRKNNCFLTTMGCYYIRVNNKFLGGARTSGGVEWSTARRGRLKKHYILPYKATIDFIALSLSLVYLRPRKRGIDHTVIIIEWIYALSLSQHSPDAYMCVCTALRHLNPLSHSSARCHRVARILMHTRHPVWGLISV